MKLFSIKNFNLHTEQCVHSPRGNLIKPDEFPYRRTRSLVFRIHRVNSTFLLSYAKVALLQMFLHLPGAVFQTKNYWADLL